MDIAFPRFKIFVLVLLSASLVSYLFTFFYQFQNNPWTQFTLLNLILLFYLAYEALGLYKKDSFRPILHPYFLTIVAFYLGMHLVPNIRLIFGDPTEYLDIHFIFWDDNPYKALNKAMILTIFSAFALFLGYKIKISESIGIQLHTRVKKFLTFSNKKEVTEKKSNLFIIFILILMGLASLLTQIQLGVWGYGISEEVFEKYSAYAQWFSYVDRAQLLCVMILAYSTHSIKKSSSKTTKTLFYLLLAFLSFQGFLFGSKGNVIYPIIVAGVAAYLATGRIIYKYIYLTLVLLAIAFVTIEPYRIVKAIYPDATFTESLALLSSVPDLIQEETVEEDVTLLERAEDLSFWFFGRLDQFSFGANAIEYKDRYGIPFRTEAFNNPDFLGSIIYSPVLAFVPRLIWKDKPRDQIGTWYNDFITNTTYYSATDFGAVAYAYYAGGWVAIFLVFSFFGMMQRIIFESFFKLKNIQGVLTYFALVLPIVFIESAVGGVITGFFRAIPMVLIIIFLIFLDYESLFKRVKHNQ
tara:strand:+ start:21151 stop:22722 length:1572 start_codon:yes stop_codon:yes gene_type:complete